VTADAAALYDAGTVALEQRRIGEAVAFLSAARRIDPRAPDVNRNLTLAEARVAESTGAGTAPPPPSPIALSPVESWWLAALLVAGAAALGAAVALRAGRRARATRIAALVLASAGVLLGGWRGTRAVEERTHPEAVVIAPSLEARRGPDEPPRPPVELRAGERVRLGRARGGDVEVRLGGSAIGWAAREGLWRVSDAARYTAAFRPR
jgi:hypothetical protein